MTIANKREPFILFLGDIAVFAVALWLTLFLRYGEMPSATLIQSHIAPFSILFLIWIIVFFIVGLYEKHTMLLKSRLPSTILNAEIINSVIAVLFFYFLPYFGINPKTNLFIYLIVSFMLILAWRMYGASLLGFKKRERAILIGSGEEMKELKEEINSNPKYSIYFVSFINLDDIEALDFQNEVLNIIYSEGISSIVIDLKNEKVEPILPKLYNLIFSSVKFIDMYKVYEDTFDRIPLSLLNYNWFLENISRSVHAGYDFLKRLMDMAVAFLLGIFAVLVIPFVALSIKLDDGGDVFIMQERVGKNRRLIKTYKFRSMEKNEIDPTKASKNKVTHVGGYLRLLRIDELPQLWSVLLGDMSLIGPRPELPSAVNLYEAEIPYYGVRHLVSPGLSGWAQIYGEHAHHGTDVSKTKNKLSYDLYYIKNRSLVLDLKIALRTLKILFSRSGV